MTTYKTAELTGSLLDAAVAKAEGVMFLDGAPSPAEEWVVGGPIIERERIALVHLGDAWLAECPNDGARAKGPTPLTAAMRARVARKFGETVDLP